MNTLIIADLQNDFLPGGALPVPGGDEVLGVANRLQPFFDLVVATQDWHPANHASFADCHDGMKPGDSIQLDGLRQILWPRHCVQGTSGAEFAAELELRRVAKIFHKGTDPNIDSYSGFFDNDYRRATGLGDSLRLQGVTDVYVLGLATDYCVKHTAIDARKLGFNTFVIADACRGIELNPGDIERALDDMRRAGVVVLTSSEVGHYLSRDGGETQLIAETDHLRLVRRGGWEFVHRRGPVDVVAVMALSDAGRILLVEQYRRPVNARVIELPAGLARDAEDARTETLVDAARRELLEETGYAADCVQPVFEGPSSAGLTDEMIFFLVATGLSKVTAGGGVDDEKITVHEVPLNELPEWIETQRQRGCLVDARLYTGVYLLERFLKSTAGG
jgi:nicotinamidase/pyrazinamidase